MKMLFYGESPVIQTGAGKVSYHLLRAFQMIPDIEITVVAINHYGILSYDETRHPYHIVPVDDPQDMHNLPNARRLIREAKYDLLFLTGDINILASLIDAVSEMRCKERRALWSLAAFDTDCFNANYLDILHVSDRCFTYSEFARTAALSKCPGLTIDVILLGCEPDIFHPVDETFRTKIRAEVFKCEKETFLVTCVNRNQARKDLARTIAAFHHFHSLYPNSRLYLHSKMQDIGGHLPTQAALLGCRITGEDPEVIFAPADYDERIGVGVEALNGVYAAADVCVSTSSGEAWGLTTTEAMSAGTPFIGPNNSTFPELLGECGERGLLADCGGPELWMLPYGLSEGPRLMTSIGDMARKMYNLAGSAKRRRAIAERARAWTLVHTWGVMESLWMSELLRFKRFHQETLES